MTILFCWGVCFVKSSYYHLERIRIYLGTVMKSGSSTIMHSFSIYQEQKFSSF